MADEIHDAALAYCARGFAVHWLCPKSKAPIAAGWNAAAVATAEKLGASFRIGNNVGFRAGNVSTVDGRPVCVLDVDVWAALPTRPRRWLQPRPFAVATLITT